jgi:S-phase kinase-associated protein 1
LANLRVFEHEPSAFASLAMVKFTSSDKQEFSISKEVASMSVLIRNLLQDIGEDSDMPIPLPNVSGHILAKGFNESHAVIEYAQKHKDDIPVPEDELKQKSSDDISDWDKEFINVDQGTLFEIILAANYLDVKGLLDLGIELV